MPGGDSATGWVDDTDGSLTLLDELSTDYLQPQLDTLHGGTMDLYNGAGQQAGGVTTIAFSRLLVASDAHDVAIVPGPMFLNWAYSTSDGYGLVYGKHTDKGSTAVTWVATTPRRPPPPAPPPPTPTLPRSR